MDYRLEDGVFCRAAPLPDGWLAVAAVVPDVDRDYVAERHPLRYRLRAGCDFAHWSRACRGIMRRLKLLRRDARGIDARELACAPLLGGAALAGGAQPAVLWSESDGRDWALKLATPDAPARVLSSGGDRLQAPAICPAGDDWLLAAECDAGGWHTLLLDGNGRVLARLPGRNPALAGLADGQALCLVECADDRGVMLEGWLYAAGRVRRLAPVPRPDDINLSLTMCPSADGKTCLLAWECCPAWGWDERVELHRDLVCCSFDIDGQSWRGAPGTAGGIMPLDRPAFVDNTDFNGVSTRPLVFELDDCPAVAFKRFRPIGHKGFGWDVLFAVGRDSGWSAPRRLSVDPGWPEADYALIAAGGHLTCFFPCLRNEPIKSWDHAPTKLNTRAAIDWRLEITVRPVDNTLEPVSAPPELNAPYVIPARVADPAPEPPPLPAPPAGRQLYWGDLHAHTAYSKCMSANDGIPAHVLRYQHDVLGCRVLCLTDHVEYMSLAELLQVIDGLAAAAGRAAVPLFGVEYARTPAHHINLYTIDRDDFLRMRCLLMDEADSRTAFARIRREMPPGAVMAIRHFHGRSGGAGGDADFGVNGARVTDLHDPELEWAMEAAQMRGNMLTEPHPGRPLFPTNYLNAGARIGLVAGSDHARGFAPARNRFGLTGFWLDELTPRAVIDALRRRRTVACVNGKISLWTSLAGGDMGAVVPSGTPVRIEVQAAAARPLRTLALWRDGQHIAALQPDEPVFAGVLADPQPPPGPHWYVVMAEADAALRGRATTAYSSPFFIDQPG